MKDKDKELLDFIEDFLIVDKDEEKLKVKFNRKLHVWEIPDLFCTILFTYCKSAETGIPILASFIADMARHLKLDTKDLLEILVDLENAVNPDEED